MITLDWTLAAAAAIFLITLFALNRLLFKPLFRVLDERKSQTSDLRQEAQKTLGDYQSLFQQCQEKVKEEKQSGYRLAEAVRREALKEREQRIAQARATAANLLREATGKIHEEMLAAQGQLKREAEEIARIITAKVLERA